ncbi:MAG: hypothetical protein ACE5LB_06360 [Acidiferrobacterales bacterium]
MDKSTGLKAGDFAEVVVERAAEHDLWGRLV